MSKTDADTTLQELKDLMTEFQRERGWGKHHQPKNLAMSIAIEAAELMELYQWDEFTKDDKQKASDELADILSYIILYADSLDIDIAEAFRHKLERNKQKYPTTVFNNNERARDSYHQIKQDYRKGKQA